MVALYNYFKTDLEKCEYKLISDEVDKIDRDLEAAEKTLTWNSENMWDYVEGLRLAALDLNTRVKQAQANVVKIKKDLVDENEKLFKIREGEITLFVRWKS